MSRLSRMLITTSRKPSRRSRTLGRDLARVIRGKYVTRGKGSLDELVSFSRRQGHTRVIFVYDIHGNPGKLEGLVVEEDSWRWHPLIINLKGVRLQREFNNKASFKSLKIDNSTSYDIANFFDLTPDDETDNRIVVTEDKISFYKGKKEVGPALLVKGWYHASRA